MSLHEAAAFLAQQWPVFACGPDKKPVTAHGFKDATRDPAAVATMFRRPGAALIGVPTGAASDLAVIDLDVKGGAGGLEWLAANEARLPRTRRHRTRSGGVHLLFRYPADRTIRNSASKVAPGVDVRGEGGYIIAPPSDGYTIADDAMPAEMPAWLLDLLDPPAPPPAARPVVAREWRDTSAPGSRYGLAALQEEADAICNAGFGRQEATLNAAGLKIGALVAGGELEAGYARETLIRAGYAMPNQPGEPPWTPDEIRRKVERAFADGQRSPRQAPPPRLLRRTIEEFAPPEPPPLDEPPPHWQAEAEPTIGGHGGTERDILRLPTSPAPEKPAGAGLPLVFFNQIQPAKDGDDFIEGLLIRGAMSVIYGPSNCGKTFFTTDLALHVATGRRWHGREIEAGGVIYCALEGAHGISNRVAAWRQHYRFEGVEVPFAIIPVTLNLLDPEADAARVITAIERAKAEFGVPVVWTIMDTLSRAMAGGNENSPEDMGALVTNGTRIQQATGSHITWVHHSGKDQAQGARGHSLLRAATDTEIEIGRPDKDSPSTAKVTKQRELEIEGEWSFRLQAVELGTNRRGKPVTSCVLVEAEASEQQPKVSLTGGEFAGRRALIEALAAHGQAAPDSPDMPRAVRRVCTLNAWRREFYGRSTLDTQEAKQKAFKRASAGLAQKGLVGVWNDLVWDASDAE